MKSFKVNWSETATLDIARNTSGKLEVTIAVFEVEEGDPKQVGSAMLSFYLQDHERGGESWAVLVENSKMNASLRIITWFGEETPYLILHYLSLT